MTVLRFLGRFLAGLTGWSNPTAAPSTPSLAEERARFSVRERDEVHDMTMWFMADEDDW